MFRDLTSIMFPNYNYTDVEKIYVYVESVKDVKLVASFLSDNNYNINHAFEYYSDLDTGIGNILKFSVFILALLLIFTICFLTGIFEIMLKNSVGDIAVLRHLGFESKSVVKIYLYPMIIRCLWAVLVIVLCDFVLYNIGLIKSIHDIFVSGCISIMLCAVSITAMGSRVKYYSRKSVLALIKQYKVEE